MSSPTIALFSLDIAAKYINFVLKRTSKVSEIRNILLKSKLQTIYKSYYYCYYYL